MTNARSAASRGALRRAWVNLRGFSLARTGLFCEPQHLISPILTSTKCDFQVSLTEPDEVVRGATTIDVGHTSFTQISPVWSTAQQVVNTVGGDIIVRVGTATGKPVPPPASVRQSIERPEASSTPGA